MSSMFTDIKNSPILSTQGIKVSELFSVNSLSHDLYFIIGTSINSYSWYNAATNLSVTSPSFESTKITYDDLSSTAFTAIRQSDLSLNGCWKFGNNKNNRLLQATSSIDTTRAWPENKSTVNVEFFEKNILKKIEELSSYIYNDPHLPSNVGDVIFSMTLSTKTAVENIYEGEWEQITGSKFIMGEGTVLENTMLKYGDIPTGMYAISSSDINDSISEIKFTNGFTVNGKGSVALANDFKLNDNYLVEHTHRFSAAEDQFKIKWIRGWGGIPHEYRGDAIANENGTVDIFAHSFPGGCIRNADFDYYDTGGDVDMAVGGHTRNISENAETDANTLTGIASSIQHKGDKDLTMADYIKNASGGTSTEFLPTTSDIYNMNGDKIVTKDSKPPVHYNYPPFMTVYMWRRKS